MARQADSLKHARHTKRNLRGLDERVGSKKPEPGFLEGGCIDVRKSHERGAFIVGSPIVQVQRSSGSVPGEGRGLHRPSRVVLPRGSESVVELLPCRGDVCDFAQKMLCLHTWAKSDRNRNNSVGRAARIRTSPKFHNVCDAWTQDRVERLGCASRHPTRADGHCLGNRRVYGDANARFASLRS